MKDRLVFVLPRTSIIIFCLCISTSAVGMASTEKSWNFRVFLDDNEIGYHNVSLSMDKEKKRIQVDANFTVKFLFLNAYQYKHQTEESWDGACLTEIHSDTNDNGKLLFLRTKPLKNGVELTTHQGETELLGCIRSFAYWNPDLLRADRLLNTQTGEYQEVTIENMGVNTIEIDAQPVEAMLYRLVVEDKSIDLWYTADMEWLALQTTVRGGRLLSYFPARPVTQ